MVPSIASLIREAQSPPHLCWEDLLVGEPALNLSRNPASYLERDLCFRHTVCVLAWDRVPLPGDLAERRHAANTCATGIPRKRACWKVRRRGFWRSASWSRLTKMCRICVGTWQSAFWRCWGHAHQLKCSSAGFTRLIKFSLLIANSFVTFL